VLCLMAEVVVNALAVQAVAAMRVAVYFMFCCVRVTRGL
jgi:hypothetical protein